MKAANHDVSSADIADVANRAHGYVGADLTALCYEGKQVCGAVGIHCFIFKVSKVGINFRLLLIGILQLCNGLMYVLLNW